MGITVYSLAISIVFYNLALIAVFILRRSPGFRAKHTVSLLAFVTVLGVLRLILPIDLDAAYVVRSYKIIPAIEDFLKRHMFASFTYGHLLLALWAVGSLITVIKGVCIQRRFDRFLQSIDFVDRPKLLEIAAEYGNDFAVLISPQISMPFASGILYPTIYLPDAELSDAEWRMVFCHEITHIRSRDNLKKLFFLGVEALFWWNPLAHFSSSEINTLIELRCDAKVVAAMSEREQLEYIVALKAVMERVSCNKCSSVAMPLIGTPSEMQLRFEALMSEYQSYRKRWLLFGVLGIVFLLSFFVLVQPARFPLLEEITADDKKLPAVYYGSSDSFLVEPYILYQDGNYYVYDNRTDRLQIYRETLFDPLFGSFSIVEGD